MARAATPVVPVGPVAAVTLAWRRGNDLYVTVVVKAAFAFARAGRMPFADTPPIRFEEVHHRSSVTMSVREADDTAPRKAKADVYFAGQAYAPRGEAVTHLGVRIALSSAGQLVFDKALAVCGDR